MIALDLPGFGRSDQANLLYSPERYSAFLDWLVDRYVPGPYILVGHSLGGGVALHHAATSFRGPERLVLIDAAGILHRVALTRFLAEIQVPDGLPAIGQEPFRWLNRLVGGLLDRVQEQPVSLDQILSSSLLRKVFLKGNPETIAGLALVETDFSPLVERVKAPTVLLWGDDDAVAPLRTGVGMQSEKQRCVTNATSFKNKGIEQQLVLAAPQGRRSGKVAGNTAGRLE